MASGSQTDSTECQETPRCPYNCPYSPSKEDRKAVEDPVEERDIGGDSLDEVAMTIIRNSDHEADIHFKIVWDTKFGPKVGVTSTKEHADVFEELDWDEAHHKWSSERTKGTEMWEVDLDSLMYVAFYFVRNDYDVTFEDQVRKNYLLHKEGLPLVLDTD